MGESWERGSAACQAFLSLFLSFPFVCCSELFKKHSLKTEGLSSVNCLLWHSKWFEPRSIDSSYCVIVRVRVVLKRIVVGGWHFNNLSGSYLQSQVNSVCQSVMLQVWSVERHWWSKRQSPTTVLFRTTLTRTITQYELLFNISKQLHHFTHYICCTWSLHFRKLFPSHQ